ncbi:CAP domain-containing protein [Nonomuraea maritima]|uniref:CAP domain-containing protein n=1 Tax=Nonomuraea maritima TaxID=683260 RepID=UPI003714A73A
MNRTLCLLGSTSVALALGMTALTGTAHASTTAPNCKQAAKWYDAVPWDRTTGSLPFAANYGISQAVHCLIDAERAKVGLPPLTRNTKLDVAAAEHVRAAVNLKWWGRGADSHTNPKTGSTPKNRILGAGYCPKGRSWSVSETTYTGWGGKGTPRAAVHWWVYVSKDGHREILLSKSLKEIGTFGVLGGAADRSGATARNAGSYVATFGTCTQ